jgi:hypothetical protein
MAWLSTTDHDKVTHILAFDKGLHVITIATLLFPAYTCSKLDYKDGGIFVSGTVRSCHDFAKLLYHLCYEFFRRQMMWRLVAIFSA